MILLIRFGWAFNLVIVKTCFKKGSLGRPQPAVIKLRKQIVCFVRMSAIGTVSSDVRLDHEAAIECVELRFEMGAIGFYDGKDSKVRWLARCRCLVWEGWMETSPCPVFSFQ